MAFHVIPSPQQPSPQQLAAEMEKLRREKQQEMALAAAQDYYTQKGRWDSGPVPIFPDDRPVTGTYSRAREIEEINGLRSQLNDLRIRLENTSMELRHRDAMLAARDIELDRYRPLCGRARVLISQMEILLTECYEVEPGSDEETWLRLARIFLAVAAQEDFIPPDTSDSSAQGFPHSAS